MLTPEMIQGLRKPFAADAVKWKVQTNPRDEKNMALVVAFIDARDVAERLDDATGGQWSDDYSPPVVSVDGFLSVACQLTVCGIARNDVGTFALSDREDNNEDAVKAAYSDAFKRAAVKFGVNAAMYRFPTVYARVEQKGRRWMLTDESKRDLAELTTRLCEDKDIPKFLNLWVFGGTAPAQPGAVAKPAAATFTPPPPSVQANRPNLLVEAEAAPSPAPAQPPPRRGQATAPAATEAQRIRIARSVAQSRAPGLALDGLGDQFGLPNLSRVRNAAQLSSAPLTITEASTLISALALLGQRSTRSA